MHKEACFDNVYFYLKFTRKRTKCLVVLAQEPFDVFESLVNLEEQIKIENGL